MKTELMATFGAAMRLIQDRQACIEGCQIYDDGFAVTSMQPRESDPWQFLVAADATTRLGLKVPLHFFVSYRGGKLDVDAEKVADQAIACMKDLAANESEILSRRAGVRAAAERFVKRAKKLGAALELIRIDERYILPSHPSKIWQVVNFDVTMVMVSDRDGRPDVYTMDAENADEFAAYLEGSILPMQLEVERKSAVECVSND